MYSTKNTPIPANPVLAKNEAALLADRLVNVPVTIKNATLGRPNFREQSGGRVTSLIATSPDAPNSVFNFTTAAALQAWRAAAVEMDMPIPQNASHLEGKTGDWAGTLTENFIPQKEADGAQMVYVDGDGDEYLVYGRQMTFTPASVVPTKAENFRSVADLAGRIANASSNGILSGDVALFREGGKGRAGELKYETLDF
jgi:hypothetical protein